MIPSEHSTFPERLASLVQGFASENEFARLSGVTGTSLRSYLSGSSDPSRERVVRMADVGGVSVEWLASGRGPRETQARPTNGVRDASVPYRLTSEDAALERFITWLREWWRSSDTRLRTWMTVELERRFPEYAEAEKKQQQNSEKKSRA